MKTMVKFRIKNKKARNGLIAFGCIALVACVFLGISYSNPNATWNPFGTPPPPPVDTPAETVINLTDPLYTSLDLDKKDFTAALHGLPTGEDPTIFANWAVITSVNDLDDIDDDVLDADTYSRWFVGYYDTVMAVEDEAPRQYGYREAEIFKGQTNNLVTYDTPDGGAAFVVYNSVTGAYIDITAVNITYATNFTILAIINVTETRSAYVEYFSFTDWSYISLNFRLTFNGTVTTEAMYGTGMSRMSEPTLYLRFSFDYLGISPKAFPMYWTAAAITAANLQVNANGFVMRFGPTTI